MNVWKLFLTAATEAAQTAEESTGSTAGMTDMLDLFLLAMLVGFGIYAIYTAIRLRREFLLFPNKILYPGDCKPEECLDEGGFIDYILPRCAILGAALLLMGIGLGLNSYVFHLSSIWLNIATIVLPLGVFVWYILAQRKAAKLFW